MACSSTGGLLSLSPELILEIATHIVSWDDFRAGRRDLTHEYSLKFGKATLANLRLVCRYLSEVLECEIFRSLTFDFNIAHRHSSEVDDVKSRLALLASKHAMFLYLRSIDPIPLLEKAILSFQHLFSVACNIDNEQSSRIINVLSTLPSLEDVILWIGPFCHDPTRLSLNKFHDLSSLAISFTNLLSDQSREHQEQIVDHISQIIAQSPMLRYLSILQPDRTGFQSMYSMYDLSLSSLLKKVPAAQPLAHLESLHFALENMRIDKNTLPHLKALKILRIEGSAGSDCSGADIWRPLTVAQIKLREITVHHFSEPLAEYLASYSGLKKLHVLLTYYDSEFTTCDVRAFVRDVLPLHGISSTINSPRSGHNLQHSQGGLIFEIDNQKQSLSTKIPSLLVTICIDSIPKALPVVLECVTQSPTCYTERLEISYSPTTSIFGCGHGMRQHYTSTKSAAGQNWLSGLEVEDCQRYPPIISLKHDVFELRPCEGRVGMYKYQLLPPRTEALNYRSDTY